jgi:hypothetical protein
MRLPRFWRRDRRDRELQLELDAYLEHEVDRGIAAGMSPDEARAAAARRLGNTTRVREDVRDLYSLGFVEHFARDLVRGMRALRASPGFALAALLSLALGIGANTAVFELLNALRLRPLPIPRPSELAEVVVDGGTRGFGITNGDFASITAPLWDELSRRQQAFSGIFAWGTAALEIGRAGTSHRVRGLWVSGSMFDVLELRPQRGRLL